MSLLVSLAPGVERFGVRHRETVAVDIGVFGSIQVALGWLILDGTSLEIFGRFGVPHHAIGFHPAVTDAYKRDHKGALLDEDHPTLFLSSRIASAGFEVVSLKLDEHSRPDRNVFPLEHDWVWKAEKGILIATPADIFPRH